MTPDASLLNEHRAKRIGLISRDYNVCYPNGYRDFSYVLPEALRQLDEGGCDTALFSLYSIIPRKEYSVRAVLESSAWTNLKMVCLEEFQDYKKGRKADDYVVYFRYPTGWKEHRFRQCFGKVNWQSQGRMLQGYIQHELPKRIFGNVAFILCGESNAVKYDKNGCKGVIDPYGLIDALPDHVEVILNPLHDRMVRFEMTMKRRFLSQRGRYVLSVWNKGKLDRLGRTRDGVAVPWTVFKDDIATNTNKNIKILDINIGYIDICSTP